MTLLEIARIRRSVRRFENRPVEPEKIEALTRAANLARRAFGGDDCALIIFDDPAATERIRSAAVSGWQGKINTWIYVTPFPAALVLMGKPEQTGEPPAKPRYLAHAAMIMETVVMAAAEMGLGTVWMAGFNPAAISRALNLPPDWRPIIVSPLGYPTSKGRLELFSRAVAQSDRRKPLEEIYQIRGDLP
jgi:nitroreductase